MNKIKRVNVGCDHDSQTWRRFKRACHKQGFAASRILHLLISDYARAAQRRGRP
jgi:hypothetical protein